MFSKSQASKMEEQRIKHCRAPGVLNSTHFRWIDHDKSLESTVETSPAMSDIRHFSDTHRQHNTISHVSYILFMCKYSISMCIYIYIYMCMYVCMYVCIYIYINIISIETVFLMATPPIFHPSEPQPYPISPPGGSLRWPSVSLAILAGISGRTAWKRREFQDLGATWYHWPGVKPFFLWIPWSFAEKTL